MVKRGKLWLGTKQPLRLESSFHYTAYSLSWFNNFPLKTKKIANELNETHLQNHWNFHKLQFKPLLLMFIL